MTEILRKSFLEGFATDRLEVGTVLICILFTTLIAAYIFCIYKMITRNSFYNRNFNLSLVAIAIITAAIILTIQANIVVSLGMVGALSIVRFRTAIKDPMDLVFLFWSISVGIICGAGFTIVAVVASIALTIVISLFSLIPEARKAFVLVINADSYKTEEPVMRVVNENCQYAKVKARNISHTGLNLAIEVRANNQQMLIEKIMNIKGITTASFVEHNGDITV